MKIIFNGKNLHAALKKIAPAINTNAIVPVQSCVLIKASGSNATLTASSYHLRISHKMECDCSGEIEMVIPYAELVKIAQLSNGPLFIELVKNQIVITVDDDVFKIGKAEDASTFAKELNDADGSTVDVTADFFWAMTLASRIVSTAKEEFIFNNVIIDIKDKKLNVVGCDRMNLFHTSFNVENKTNVACLISTAFVNAVKEFQDATLTITKNNVIADAGTIKVTGIVSAHGAPPYDIILSRYYPETCVLSKKDLESCLSKIFVCQAFNKIYTSSFSFSPDNNKALLSYQNTSLGQEVSTVIHLDKIPELPKIDLEAGKLQTLLSLLPSDTEMLDISMKDPKTAVFIKPRGVGHITLMTMPLAQSVNQ
ncbi:hypothetical protein [Pinibacter soli]|uniref:Beta sliding clamp n=1 Tax=Pinibacter soli TaxID=3044211 RepID=A0ABT6RBP4_9BACT|nr:hypothetical protein [Pinibacter soli]MDI3319972.1 hypothetical protein [Pinibacter soli]